MKKTKKSFPSQHNCLENLIVLPLMFSENGNGALRCCLCGRIFFQLLDGNIFPKFSLKSEDKRRKNERMYN